MSVTVVTYCTPDFSFFLDGIASDCQKFGLPFYHEVLSKNFRNVIKAFDYKIFYLQQVLKKFEKVLWLDVECRLHQPVPIDWSAPLISSYEMDDKRGLSSGVLMLERSHLPILETWERYARKYTKLPDDFVLEYLADEFNWEFKYVDLDFFDRESEAQVARGEWHNSHTVVSHPSTNRWPNPKRYSTAFGGWIGARKKASKLRKSIFYRNFAGDFGEIEELMRNGGERSTIANWVFEPANGSYAPEYFWPECKDDYFSKPRTFEQARTSFYRPRGNDGYRSRMVHEMKCNGRIDA